MNWMKWKWSLPLIFIGQIAWSQVEQDSAVSVVFNTLTSDVVHIVSPNKNICASWEALAYWETNSPKEIDYLSEAVGDIYEFNADQSFLIRLLDPENPRQMGMEISGSYTISDSGNLEITAADGSRMLMKIQYLDENYLIFEIEGLRIFYTKGKSYFSYD